jgi:hypothetical protein
MVLPIATAIQNIYIGRTNSNVLKLAYLLAQYLYTNKRLDLPGIGTFLLDPAVIIETENNKRGTLPDGISFQNNPSIQNAPELVRFISSLSGKMKPLAEADLESHLQMAQQFLNISKPFTFEGIGTLVRLRPGEFEFTPGNPMADKIKDNTEKELHVVTKKDTVEAKYTAYLATPVVKSRLRKPVIILLVLCGIGLAIWGGYIISSNQSEKPEATLAENTNENTNPEPPPVHVDSSQLKKPDTVTIQKSLPAPESYKYVLEISRAPKVFNRLKQLKDTQLQLKDTKLSDAVQMETTDSVQYKLFVLLPISTDTSRVIASLTTFLGKKVYIEHQN